jgi:hypothetical protein
MSATVNVPEMVSSVVAEIVEERLYDTKANRSSNLVTEEESILLLAATFALFVFYGKLVLGNFARALLSCGIVSMISVAFAFIQESGYMGDLQKDEEKLVFVSVFVVPTTFFLIAKILTTDANRFLVMYIGGLWIMSQIAMVVIFSNVEYFRANFEQAQVCVQKESANNRHSPFILELDNKSLLLWLPVTAFLFGMTVFDTWKQAFFAAVLTIAFFLTYVTVINKWDIKEERLRLAVVYGLSFSAITVGVLAKILLRFDNIIWFLLATSLFWLFLPKAISALVMASMVVFGSPSCVA